MKKIDLDKARAFLKEYYRLCEKYDIKLVPDHLDVGLEITNGEDFIELATLQKKETT